MATDMKMLTIAQNPKAPSKVLARLFDTLTGTNDWSLYSGYSPSSQSVRTKRVLSVLLRNPNLPKIAVADYAEKSINAYRSNKKAVDYEFLQEVVSAQELPDTQLEEILNFDTSDSYTVEELVEGLVKSPKVKIHVKYNAAVKGSTVAQSYLFGEGFEELLAYLAEKGVFGEIDSDALPRQWIQKILGWDQSYAYTY